MSETMTMPRTRQGLRNLDAVRGPVIPFSGGPAPAPHPAPGINVGANERLFSSLGGGLLTLLGLSRGSLTGLGLALVGGSLLYRGMSGHCRLYNALGVNTAVGGNTSPHAEIVHRPANV